MLKVLRTSMRVLGYKYQDIEKKLDVAPGYLSRLFRGVLHLRFDHIVEIAKAMGLRPEEIFQIAFPQPPQPPSEGARRLRLAAARFGSDVPAPPEAPPSSGARGRAIEDEAERIERIVLHTFEKFFSSMARNAAGY